MKTKKSVLIFTLSLLATLIILRLFLYFYPATNLSLGEYNIHHLYIGAFLMIVLSIFFILNAINNFTITLAGIGSALVIDETIYLIATDGSDVSYLSNISLLGAIVLTAIVIFITMILYYVKKNKKMRKLKNKFILFLYS